jgi:hypothetical protein
LTVEFFVGLVSKAKEVTNCVDNHSVWQVEKISFYCISNADHEVLKKDQIPPDELDMLSMEPNHSVSGVSNLLSSGAFYFSRTMDLTRDLRHRQIQAHPRLLDSSNLAFIWNRNIIAHLTVKMQQLEEHQLESVQNSGLITPLIHGFVAFRKARLEGTDCTVAMISRMSCNRAGTRFNARGIDSEGYVSNHVESELLVYYNNKIYSYLQVRASVPLFWEQRGIQMKHYVTITKELDETLEVSHKHFDVRYINLGIIVVLWKGFYCEPVESYRNSCGI